MSAELLSKSNKLAELEEAFGKVLLEDELLPSEDKTALMSSVIG